MNQIPNIEETDTREGIERTEFVATLTKHALGMQSKFLEKKNWIEYIINSTLRNAEHEHHQQLQKAREVEGGIEEWKKRAKRYRDTLYIKQHMLYMGEKQDYGELCEAMRNACDAIDALIANTDHQLQKAKKQQQEV